MGVCGGGWVDVVSTLVLVEKMALNIAEPRWGPGALTSCGMLCGDVDYVEIYGKERIATWNAIGRGCLC
jgi:hypothetical protein